MQRLHLNHDGYRGETIDITTALGDCTQAARRHGWIVDAIPAAPGLNLVTLKREAAPGLNAASTRRVYLSTGIHGDEPAGPLAILRLLEANAWPEDAELSLCPCLNPTGFPLNRRENASGLDLNRDYRNPQSAEIRAHVAWLERQPVFDLTLCLHEDWETHGFYVYELNPDGRASAAEKIVAAVSEVCPIDGSEVIEGRPASGGIIRPNLDPATRPQWAEAFWLLQNKTRLSYTLEAPSDFRLETRVKALVAGVDAALNDLRATPPPVG